VLTDVGKKTADLVEVKHDGRSNGGSLPRSQPRSKLARLQAVRPSGWWNLKGLNRSKSDTAAENG
jgi:hypothetical protein